MNIPPGVIGDAEPRGLKKYRYWLSRVWNQSLPTALVIGINPNTATEFQDDGMTSFLTRFLRQLEGEYQCGGFFLVNCFDYRDRTPKALLNVDQPTSEKNIHVIKRKLEECDFVVVSWGTTAYGKIFEERRKELSRIVRASDKPAICFSPIGAPIYCSQTNANRIDGKWSSKPVSWRYSVT
jgi:hypothetical protein